MHCLLENKQCQRSSIQISWTFPFTLADIHNSNIIIFFISFGVHIALNFTSLNIDKENVIHDSYKKNLFILSKY